MTISRDERSEARDLAEGLGNVHPSTVLDLLDALDDAEQRLQAVEDVLAKTEARFVGAVDPKYRGVRIADIRRALDGDA